MGEGAPGLEPVLAEEARARGWTAAIRLDPRYALAYRNRAGVESLLVNHSVAVGTNKKNR